ncbi:DUF2752 domain-containing protein [Blastopirellula sp. JC732]|uniref:DUF2752 domain-containing protein n=1 Tax=Blastopirellula sediminis TaxID=2894196 RepID=A0A9X1SI44_9BACT|nr:DUF2752 domain-containing protein [Blastopirellula sediminis]MCC9604801.1 DUF2752 domain-containing protein [Blastopirellula sediminis]MCC9631900.1 DUF2752 domain-containing protein [Blastopirellula sediminis]
MSAPPPSSGSLGWFRRSLLGLVGLIVAGLLGTAAMLTPNNQGLGTHQQLGLPPCSSRVWFGVRCPACGMTTSWAYLTKGNVVGSIRSNAAGFLLGLTAMASAPWLLVTAFRGRPPLGYPNEIVALVVVCSIAAVMVAEWLFRVMS